MNRDQVVSSIRARANEIRSLGADAVYLFGSAARDELRDGSDIDVFIDRASGFDYRFHHLTRLQALLERELNRPVDVMTRSSLHPLLKREIEAAALRVL